MRVTLLALDESCAVDIGLRIISSLLKENGYKVDMLFNIIYTPDNYFSTTTFNPKIDNFESINYAAKQVTNFVKENHSDLLGISVSTNHFERAARITEMVKQSRPELFVVWGGVHPTVRPQECLDYADCVCIGEGEKPILELVNRISSGGNIYSTPSFWFKNKNTIIRNEVDSIIDDINTLPFQDYDLADHYLIKRDEGLEPMNDSLMHKLMPRYTLKVAGSYALMATRGCPYSCSYCINNFTNQLYNKQKRKNIVRRRSVENIIAELIGIRKRFPSLSSVFFTDDLFIFGEDSDAWLEDFSRQYKEKISLPFMCSMHFSQINDRVMDLLVKAGLVQLSIGIESGSERTLKNLYQRNLMPKAILNKAEIVNRYKKYVVPSYDIILDNPYESDDDLRQTLELILKLSEPFHLGLYSLTLFPGIPLYQRAKSEGLLTDELNQVYRKHYNDIDTGKYINQLFLLYGSIPKKMITYFLRRHDSIHKFILFLSYCIWYLRHLIVRNRLYFCLKKVPQKWFLKGDQFI